MNILSTTAKKSRIFIVRKLKLGHIKNEFKQKLQNGFEMIQALDDKKINDHWNELKEIFFKTKEEVIDKKNATWIKNEHLRKLEKTTRVKPDSKKLHFHSNKMK